MSDTTTMTADGPGAAANALPPPRFDFPTWLPPMLVKELRQGLRQRGFVGGLIVVQAILLIVFVTGFVTDVDNGSSRSMIDGFFWSMMGFVLIGGAPMRALTGLSAELDSRTMDLLLLTRLDAWRIVWGKWVSLVTQTLLLAVTLLPYAVVRYFFGAVDLVSDFATITGLFLGGAVLTGVGLWASGLPRALRMLMIIGLVIMFIGGMNGLMFGLRHSGMSFTGGGGPGVWVPWALGLWGGALTLLYSLTMAVRWFAPPAENHAIIPRLLPLAMALPAPLLVLFGETDAAAAQALSSVVALAVVAAIELAGTREVMAIHLRGWMARGGWRRPVGPLFLPGWQSACAWLAAMTVLVVLGWGLVDAVSARDLKFAQVAWLAVLGWAGLVFPIVLVSLVPSVGKVSGVLYFALHGVLGVFAGMARNASLGRLAPTPMWVMDWISHAVPTASFWHAVTEFNKPSELPAVGFAQTLGVVVTLALMLWLARPYWAAVRAMRRDASSAGASE